MKNSKTSLALAALLLACVAVNFIRASTIWQGSYVSINNTTWNSPTNSLLTVNVTLPATTFYLSNNLSRTSDITNFWDLSLDGVNFTNVWSYTFPQTNAGTYATNPGLFPMTVYARLRTGDSNQNYQAMTSNP